MPLNTKTKEQFLSDIITSWAGYLGLSPNLQSGNPLLAIFQSYVLCGLMFLQSQAVAVNKLTRAKTSEKADLDSWTGDFGFDRIPSVKGHGEVKFSLRYVSNQNIEIPVGTIVQTKDAKIQYEVIADENQGAYNATKNVYILTAGSLSCDASVRAVKAGKAYNVQIGALSQIVSQSTGINYVTNLASIQNGDDPEEDQRFRDRFKLFINTPNARTTPAGILSAALAVPGVVDISIIENYDRYGNPQPGYVVVVIDDGSGEPSSDLIAEVTKAVAAQNSATRGATVQILVIGPTLSVVDLALNVKISPLAQSAGLELLAVENALIDYVNALKIGETLYLENLSAVAKSASPYVIAVQSNSVKINNAEADHNASSQTVIRTDNTHCVISTW